MRFLRMLTNAVVAGALGAAYLTVLVLQLNPHVPLLSATTLRWFAALGALYGIHLAVLFYVLMVAREFFSLDTLSPGWVSVRVLAWLSSGVSAVAALLMWMNVSGFGVALDEVAARRMTAGALATAACAVVLLGIAIAHYSSGRRGNRVGAALFAIAVIGSVALPVAARGPAIQRPPAAALQPGVRPVRAPTPRVHLLLFDGASLEYIWTRAAEGRLPNFARLIDSGAAIDLATIRPTQPDPVWAAVATGMYPPKNGAHSAAAYYAWGDDRPIDLLPDHCFAHALVTLGIIRGVPNSSSSWRSRPFWTILADAGVSVGIVRWPLTYPAQPVLGFLVADRFHDALGSMFEFDEGAVYPASVMRLTRRAVATGGTEPVPSAYRTAEDSPEESALARDRFYGRVMQVLRSEWNPQVTALRYVGLDHVGHRNWSAAQPRSGADPSEQQRRRSAQMLERAYLAVDAEVGVAMQSLAADDLLLVIGGFGMQRRNPTKRILGRMIGDGGITGTHERAPDGFLLAYGTAVEPGRRQRGSVVDVTPTLLYYLGLPVGRDMDGYARSDLFRRAFTSERPIAFIPTHNR